MEQVKTIPLVDRQTCPECTVSWIQVHKFGEITLDEIALLTNSARMFCSKECAMKYMQTALEGLQDTGVLVYNSAKIEIV